MKKREKERGGSFGIIVLILVLAIAGVGGYYVVSVIGKAPQISTFDAEPKGYRSTVLDRDGAVVLTLADADSNRVYVKRLEIPENLVNAVIAIEDQRFYQHNGVDLKGIARAFFKGIKNGNFSEGASTITQQLLKNNVFTSWTSESSFEEKLERKIQEQYLAIALEKKVSKDWILENYLNTINLGGGNLGVETAARYYFDKDVSALTLSECAVLAATIKSPTSLNPLRHPEENAERRAIILSYMVAQGMITEEEKEEALADKVYERIAAVSSAERTGEVMSYFEDALMYTLVEDLGREQGLTEAEAWELLYSGGLTIYSTESSSLQEILEDAAKEDTLYPEGGETSMVMIDNVTGEVLAMVGGRGEKTASLLYNRATKAVRQPGSTIKILGTYANGLDSGIITLGTAVDDAPYTYSNGQSIVNASGQYGGMTTVRSAIVSSNNIVALKCFQKSGLENVYAQLLSFGITTLTEDDKVEALALGGTYGGVTNLELSAAYASIARGGVYLEPIYYTKVVDAEGNILLEKQQELHRVIEEETAILLTDALSDAAREGTGSNAYFDTMAIAGKSGTTSGVRDAWFVGYSPYFTLGIWGGYDDNRAQEESTYVQRIWKLVMEEAHDGLAYVSFEDARDGEYCTICTKCGLLAVEGLCDHSVQGDMSAVEYFKAGTAPTTYCDCHVKVTLCTESGMKAGRYCTDTEEKVYLVSASEGTADETYVLPESAQSACTNHQHFWSGWFGGGTSFFDKDDTDPSGSSQGEGWNGHGQEEDGPSSNFPGNFWGWLFGN